MLHFSSLRELAFVFLLKLLAFLHIGEHMLAYKLRPHEKITAEGVYYGIAILGDEHLKIIHGMHAHKVAGVLELAEILGTRENGNEHLPANGKRDEVYGFCVLHIAALLHGDVQGRFGDLLKQHGQRLRILAVCIVVPLYKLFDTASCDLIYLFLIEFTV